MGARRVAGAGEPVAAVVVAKVISMWASKLDLMFNHCRRFMSLSLKGMPD